MKRALPKKHSVSPEANMRAFLGAKPSFKTMRKVHRELLLATLLEGPEGLDRMMTKQGINANYGAESMRTANAKLIETILMKRDALMKNPKFKRFYDDHHALRKLEN
jgi:hypothetical protein